MQVNQRTQPLVFTEDEDEIRVCYSNRGEPFRDGVEFQFSSRFSYSQVAVRVLLDAAEVRRLRDKLNEFLEPITEKEKQ